MAQQVINVGTAPNDGTGDPLRTAYIKTNDNFGELYNRVQTAPPASLTGSIGDTAGMYAYDQNYFYYCYADFDGSSQIWNQITNTGNVSVTNIASGNSSIGFNNVNGNASINIRGVGNVAVFSNTAVNVTGNVVATGNVNSGNLNTVSIHATGLISAAGTVTGNYFVGNGAFLTGIATSYGNANVATYLPTYTGGFANLLGNVTTTANVQGVYILGNGSQLTGLPATYSDANVATYLPTYTGGFVNLTGNITTTANVQGNYILGNGSQLTGLPANYGNANVASYLPTYTGNLSPGNLTTTGIVSVTGNISAGNVLQNGIRAYKYSAGNTAPTNPVAGDNWWYTAGNVLYQYINDGVSTQWVDVFDPSFPPSSTSVSANTIAQRDANGNLSANVFSGTSVSVTGNVAGSYIIGDGSQLTNIQAASMGSANVFYTAPYANSTVRSQLSKNADTISVRDFGATGNGTTDDTAAIQAAINAAGTVGGAQVFFPSGTYKISSALTMSSTAVVLVGASRYGTTITQATANAKILNISGNFCGVKGLGFNYSGTPLNGATAIYVTSSYVTLNDFVVLNSYIGVYFNGSGAVAGKVSQFELFNYVSVGLQCESLNDVFISQFIMNAGDTTKGALGGIRLYGKVEAFVATDGDILLGAYSMTTDAASNTVGNRPAYNNFTNVFFDSSTNGAAINRMVETEFVGCWFSDGRNLTGQPGCVITNSSSLNFTNCRFFNCGGSGCYLDASSVRVNFTSCNFESNSQTAGAGVAAGLTVAANTQHFQVLGCIASNTLYNGQQGYGIVINAGCDYFNVSNNDFTGNSLGGIANGSGTGATKIIASNFG